MPRRGDDAGLGKEPNGDCDADACKEPKPSSKLLLARRAAGMELHDTAHTPAMRTAPTRRNMSSLRPQLLRRLLRLLAMVFGEGSAALERSGGTAAPGTPPPSPAPSCSALP